MRKLVAVLAASLALGVTGCLVAVGGTRAPSVTPSATTLTPAEISEERAEIMQMMAASAQAWTRGDLDGFMSYYAPDTSTTYVGRNRILHGRAEIRANYAPRFAPGATHDSLSFEDVDIDVLAPGVANVLAYYRLSRGDSTVARGPTTVVVRRFSGEWRIIHDHSS